MINESAILLQGGIVLQHDENDNINILRDTNILVQGNKITHIDRHIQAPRSTEVIDCHDKIICPGFIDTHHHVWQTQLKGRHCDDTLLDYHPKGNLQYFNYTPEDVFWGELGGLMEMIDGGTTTVVDHAHMSRTADHVEAGLSATLASNTRSVYCTSLVPQIKTWDKSGYELDTNPLPSWFLPHLEQLCRRPEIDGIKLSIGLGFDAWYLPQQDTVDVFNRARKAGTQLITSHWRRNTIAASASHSVPHTLKSYSLLAPDILLSHGTGSTPSEFSLMRKSGVAISCTPATESQMAHGDIVGFRSDVIGSLGADCHSSNPASILHAMRTGLSVARALRNHEILAEDKFPAKVEPTTQQAFNLATIKGARAIRMEEHVGSLKVGKQADLLIIGTESPGMTCAVDHDPLAAVVQHASNSDIETVMVAGEFLKEDGKLVDVEVDEAGLGKWEGSQRVKEVAGMDGKLPWKTVAKELRRSRGEIQARIDECDVDAARAKVLELWGFKGDQATFV